MSGPQSGPSSCVGSRGGALARRLFSSTRGGTVETILVRSLAFATREGRSVCAATSSGCGACGGIFDMSQTFPTFPLGLVSCATTIIVAFGLMVWPAASAQLPPRLMRVPGGSNQTSRPLSGRVGLLAFSNSSARGLEGPPG